MPTQQPVQSSRAHRWAYACGLSVKRGYRKLKALESRVVEGAETAGMPAGKLLVRGGFLVIKLAIAAGLLLVSLWFTVSVMILIVLCWAIANGTPIKPKDALRYKAYGDPYGEYEYGRAPGQPDLKDL
ncbi:DUF3742 family protein [Pseudomonas fluorescens]|uniref:DUF3742 family protein n=1 Tax=Pseudomonas TaxID=286 RepID=UPI00059B6E18|nr:DUF3742 family protein [Pseudomonas fluorescens]MBY9026222.1 DUF3742 family protein [Pseudomonas fluorescens]MBY9030067.1 DUF3742 family protein [Pseudomonas fluorescens]MBY9038040.1 DUF3742 family protein [Pseudomonas fluorescens]MBY9044144.1 DUF3742 family protein [Pseudomonas fluorescens]MBY9049844.1 DUF3742 family protein [Pseudomonas fluorescens]